MSCFDSGQNWDICILFLERSVIVKGVCGLLSAVSSYQGGFSQLVGLDLVDLMA